MSYMFIVINVPSYDFLNFLLIHNLHPFYTKIERVVVEVVVCESEEVSLFSYSK